MAKITTHFAYRHGDLLLKRVAEIPKSAKPTSDTVLAYGEVTGHKHQLRGKAVQVFQEQETKYIQLLEPAELVHEEHKKIDLDAGNYVLVHEREFDPFESEIRRVAD